MDNETYDMQWDIFSRRLQGILPGPMLSKSVSQNEEEYHMHLQDIMELDERVNTALAQRSSKPPATDAETAADSTAAAPAVDGESNGESADGTKVEPTATAGSKTERFSFRDVVVMEKEKPSTPTILLAPMVRSCRCVCTLLTIIMLICIECPYSHYQWKRKMFQFISKTVFHCVLSQWPISLVILKTIATNDYLKFLWLQNCFNLILFWLMQI